MKNEDKNGIRQAVWQLSETVSGDIDANEEDSGVASADNQCA